MRTILNLIYKIQFNSRWSYWYLYAVKSSDRLGWTFCLYELFHRTVSQPTLRPFSSIKCATLPGIQSPEWCGFIIQSNYISYIPAFLRQRRKMVGKKLKDKIKQHLKTVHLFHKLMLLFWKVVYSKNDVFVSIFTKESYTCLH